MQAPRVAAPVTYQLYIHMPSPARLHVGALGWVALPAGWYVYTGSARRGFHARVRRHLRRDKRRRWHIDWLLLDTDAQLVWVVCSGVSECRLNQATRGGVIRRGLGASDCKRQCGSHLRFLGPARPWAVPSEAVCRQRLAAFRATQGGDMATTDDELLETLNDAGEPAGLVPRDRVHAEGLWHRAAHVWLYDRDGNVYVQRRSPYKDLNPDCWDVSVGEHLQPGEGYYEAAQRGLREELGLVDLALTPVGAPRPLQVDRPASGIHDYEYQQVYTAFTRRPPVPEPSEVTAVRLVAPDELRRWLAAEPDGFTPGFRGDVTDLNLP